MNCMLKLKNIPANLQDQLVIEFQEIKRKYTLEDWGSSELSAGRFAEVVLRIFQYLIGDNITPFGGEIKPSEKEKLINKVINSSFIDEHIRQKVASLTRMLLDFRNNRDAAHIGGFDASNMDAFFTLSCTKWILAELIRVYGDYTMKESEKIISEITIKELPAICEINGEQFIAKNKLSSEEEILILLYKNSSGIDYNFIFLKTKDSNQSRFKRRLTLMQSKKLIAKSSDKYYLMPLGIKLIEKSGLLT